MARAVSYPITCSDFSSPDFCSCRFLPFLPTPRRSHIPTPLRPISSSASCRTRLLLILQAMGSSKAGLQNDFPIGLDSTTEEEYASQSKLLKEFTDIPSISKAWVFKSDSGSQAMFAFSQANLLANKMRKFMLSSRISKESDKSVKFLWAPFPIEMTGASAIVPSPSGSRILVVRNSENESPTQFEIWGPSRLEREFHTPQSLHGSVYVDGWFEGISWNSDETLIAYVAEEAPRPKPTFNYLGYKKEKSADKEGGSWKGQGDWEEGWGESYVGKRQPALFVISVESGEVQPVRGIPRSLSAAQVVWGPSLEGSSQFLVFVGWCADSRKLGIKYCENRPCALYAVRAPVFKQTTDENKDGSGEEDCVFNLTQSISSAFCPRFSPDGKFLVFLSAKSAVDSGTHGATQSLHKLGWPTNGKLRATDISDVVSVVKHPADGCFPGLYYTSFPTDPWLSDGHTMILSSIWNSSQVILAVDVLSGDVSRISPVNADSSWNLLALDGDNIIAASSSPVDVPEIKYGNKVQRPNEKASWNWLKVSGPAFRCSEKVTSMLSSLEYSILQIPVRDTFDCLTEGAKKPFEAIFVSSKKEEKAFDPLIVVVHGGPHAVSLSSYSKSLAYLASIGNSLLIVNYRGSLGFGDEALQSLPGKAGSQDVNDVLTAIDHAIDLGLADPSKITVLGGSHGGFLATHLIGQAPDKFVAAAVRNPVCNISSMVGVTDIPDWCYVEAYGSQWRNNYTEAPSPNHLARFHSASPISHISKVKTPTLFLLGAQDLRVPVSNGVQFSRALREQGVEVKVILFPNDIHAIDRPQSDFESFLNIAVWFKKHCG